MNLEFQEVLNQDTYIFMLLSRIIFSIKARSIQWLFVQLHPISKGLSHPVMCSSKKEKAILRNKESVVNITQMITVNKSDLAEKIGSLSPHRVREIIEGFTLLIAPREI